MWRWLYLNSTPFVQVLISASAKLITCGRGAIMMWDRIYQMSNSQTTNSQMYWRIPRIRMTNFSGTRSLLLQNLQSQKQLPDACWPLLKNHPNRPYWKHPRDVCRPPPHDRCLWTIPCQRQHLVLLFPSKAINLGKGPWCPWPSIQALRVPSRNVLWLRLMPIIGRPKRLPENTSREVSTPSNIEGWDKVQKNHPY